MAKLLLLCETFPPNVGGSEALMLHYARTVQSLGHEIAVLCPSSNQPRDVECAFDAAEPYSILRSGMWRRLFRLGAHRSGIISRLARAALVFLVFFRALLVRDVQAIIVALLVPGGNVAAAIKRIKHIPIIAVVYGEEIKMYARGPRSRALLISALRAADVIRCLTEYARGQVATLVPEAAGRIEVAPPPAELSTDYADPVAVEDMRRQFGLHGKQVILTVGRLVPRKGIDLTLRSLAILSSEFPDLVYVVVGEGGYRPALEQLAREIGVSSRTIFTGRVPDVTPYYHVCDIFVTVNRELDSGEEEGYGIVFLEAGLAGKPVIGGRSAGATEAIVEGETGFLVDPCDPTPLAEKIRQLLTDETLRTRMGKAGRTRARAISDPERLRAELADVLSRTI